MSGAGGSATFTVSTGSACTWSVTNNTNFLTVTPTGLQTGPGSVTFTIADANATGDKLTFRFAYKSAVISGVCFGRSFVGLWRQSTGDGEVALEFSADFESAEGWWTWPHGPARHRAFIRARTPGDAA